MSKQKSIIGQTFRNSVVSIIVAAVAVLLGVIIDGVVIGRYLGPDSMAAYTLMTPLISVITAVSSVLSTGVQVICAQHIGSGDTKRARQAFSVCMVTTLIISVIITTSAVIFRAPIAEFLGASGNSACLLPSASDYLLGLALACPASIFLFEFNSIIRLDGGSLRIIIAVAVMTVLDIVGDLLNVFVFHGGMFGMGLATSVSYLVALVIMGLHFLRKDIIFRFSLKGMRIRDMRDILVTGAPSAVGAASTALRTLVHNLILTGTALSINAVGAFGILNTVFNFTSCVLIGVAITTSMIAGMVLGEQDRTSARELMRIALMTATLIGTCLCVSVFICARPIASIFGSKDGEVMVELAAHGLRFFSVSLLMYGINSTFTNYLQGMRRMVLSNVFSFLHTFLFLSAAAMLLAPGLETDAVWLSFPIGEACTLLCFCILAGVLNKRVPVHLSDFLFLPEPFGAPESEVLNVTVTDASEVKDACGKLTEFCTSKGASGEQISVLTSYAEELADKMTETGFTDGKLHILEIRVTHAEDGFTMRLRDNCKPYDASKDVTAEGAKSISYINTLDLNIITVRV